MKKTLSLIAIAFALFSNAQEQNTSAERIDQAVADNIQNTKKKFQNKIDAVNRAVAKGLLTKEEADKIIAKIESSKIETLTSNIEYVIDWEDYETQMVDSLAYEDYTYDWDFQINEPDESYTDGEIYPQKTRKKIPSLQKSGFVFGVGLANLAHDNHFPNSEFGYTRSSNLEWGWMSRVPFSKKNTVVGLKYGLTFNYYQLHPTQNRYFVKDRRDLYLDTHQFTLDKDRAFLRNTYITIPLMLDFNFSDKYLDLESQKWVRKDRIQFAIGGYIGYNINSKQFLFYKNETGHLVKSKQKGEWNATDFQYGLQASIGYRGLHLYGKYDLNPTFRQEPKDMNFWALGIRIELLD